MSNPANPLWTDAAERRHTLHPRLGFVATIREIRAERRRLDYARDNLVVAAAREILTERLAALAAQERANGEKR